MAGSSQGTSATSSIPLMTPVAFSGARDVFAGRDTTAADSGNCSINEKLEIELPFRLEKLT